MCVCVCFFENYSENLYRLWKSTIACVGISDRIKPSGKYRVQRVKSTGCRLHTIGARIYGTCYARTHRLNPRTGETPLLRDSRLCSGHVNDSGTKVSREATAACLRRGYTNNHVSFVH